MEDLNKTIILYREELSEIEGKVDVKEWERVQEEGDALLKAEEILGVDLCCAEFSFQEYNYEATDGTDMSGTSYTGARLEIDENIFIYFNADDKKYDFYITDSEDRRIQPDTFFGWVKDEDIDVPSWEIEASETVINEWIDFLRLLKEHMYHTIESRRWDVEGFLDIIGDEDIDWLMNDDKEKVGAIYRGNFMFSFSIDLITQELSQGIDINPSVKWDWGLFQEITK